MTSVLTLKIFVQISHFPVNQRSEKIVNPLSCPNLFHHKGLHRFAIYT
jgi:hypothetical protein